MTLKYNISSTSSLVLNSLILATATALTASNVADQFQNIGDWTKHSYEVKETVYEIKDWEKTLKGFYSTGGMAYFTSTEDVLFSGFGDFAKRLVSNLETVPEDFERVFSDNFWDILA